jgi:hypothetical protein
MDIPAEKKPMFYLVSVPVFVAGLVLGALIVSYVFFQTKDTICLMNQPPVVNTELTPAQLERAGYLEQNRSIFGEVTVKEASSFTLQFFLANPLDSRNSTTTSVNIPFDQNKDEVMKLRTVLTQGVSTVKETKASFSDVKVGEQVLVKILDGKKTIYITPSS